MGHTLLCVLGIFLMNTHKFGHTQAQNVKATLRADKTTVPFGGTVMLTCSVMANNSSGWKYQWFMQTTDKESKEHSLSDTNRTISVTKEGIYWCRGGRGGLNVTEDSNPITIHKAEKPKARIKADKAAIPVGGSVTLSCTVNSSSGWKYFWYRGKKNPKPLTADLSGKVTVSQGGDYWCRGKRDPVYYTDYSFFTLNKLVANKAVVTLQPNWPKIYKEETITLKCEIKDGEGTEWTYEWQTSSSFKPPKQSESRLIAYASHNGVYKCKGRNKSETTFMTEWSGGFKLTVFDQKPQPVLSVSPLWLSPGDSVNLSCEFKEHPSAGWRFYWYKAVPDLSSNDYSYELLPGSSSGTEQDSYIVHGQTHTAGYVCRAGRGHQVSYTQYSEPKFVLSGDFLSSASLTVSPDRVQHFTSDSVSLSCEGDSAEWRVMMLKDSLLDDSNCGEMTAATCSVHKLQEGTRVYWCESGSGEFSNAVNITAQKADIILVSPVHPVTEGDFVSLSCRLRRQTNESNVFFYLNEKLIQNDTRRELNISAVSKSDEGFYKCQYSGKESPESWVAVKSSESESSSLVAVVTGLFVSIVVIILLLLLCHFKMPKDRSCDGPIQSPNTNQCSVTDRTVNQDATQQPVYSGLLHGDVSIYESVKSSNNRGNDGADNVYSDITFQLEGLERNSKHDDSVESSDYYNLKPVLATGP